jgi:DNA-binding transcriptional LysR family regulator
MPTAEALTILNIVRPAFSAFERLRDLNHAAVPKMAWLNFGAYESVAIDVLPGLIHRLRATMPDLKLSVRVSRTQNLLSMVRTGELCSALIAEVDDMERFYAREVCSDRLGFYVSSKHPIAELGWKAVNRYGIGSLTPGKEGLPRYFTKFLRQLDGVRPSVLSDSFEVLRHAAASGTIVAVLPNRVARRLDDLLEVSPPGSSGKSQGEHRIWVVSQANCDVEEVDFLAREAVRSLNPQ